MYNLLDLDKTQGTNYVVRYGLKEILDNAFQSGTFTSILIPESVTVIGNRAFQYCNKLDHITIPISVTKIGDYAFSRCESLANIEIPNSVISIGKRAFEGCISLREIEIPESITKFENGLFEGCKNLKEIHVRQKDPFQMSISMELDEEVINKVTLIVPEGTSKLYKRHSFFSKFKTIKERKIKSNNEAASDKKSTDSKTNNKGKTKVVKNLLDRCGILDKIHSTPTHYVIQDGITVIPEYAFFENKDILTIQIPDSVKEIESGAFRKCTSLKKITIPNSVKYIGKNIFSDCEALENVELPNSIKKIEDGMFCNCKNLSKVKIPNTVNSIGSSSFCGCESITNIEIPDSVKSIGFEAFYGCTSITNIALPNSIDGIEFSAFKDCVSLHSLQFAEGITMLGSSSVSSLIIKSFIKSGGCTFPIFEGCISLKSIIVPNTVTSIYYSFLCNCPTLKEIHLQQEDPNCIEIKYNGKKDIILYVPNGCSNAYKKHPNFSKFKSIKEDPSIISNNTPKRNSHITKGQSSGVDKKELENAVLSKTNSPKMYWEYCIIEYLKTSTKTLVKIQANDSNNHVYIDESSFNKLIEGSPINDCLKNYDLEIRRFLATGTPVSKEIADCYKFISTPKVYITNSVAKTIAFQIIGYCNSQYNSQELNEIRTSLNLKKTETGKFNIDNLANLFAKQNVLFLRLFRKCEQRLKYSSKYKRYVYHDKLGCHSMREDYEDDERIEYNTGVFAEEHVEEEYYCLDADYLNHFNMRLCKVCAKNGNQW